MHKFVLLLTYRVKLQKVEKPWTGERKWRKQRLTLRLNLSSTNMSACWHSATQNTALNSRHSWLVDVKLVKWSNPTNTCALPLFKENKPSVIAGRSDLLTWLRCTVWALGSRSRINGSLALWAFVHVVFLWGGNISFVSPQASRPQTSWKEKIQSRGRGETSCRQAGRDRRETGRRLDRLEENEHQEMFQVYPSAEKKKSFCNIFVSVPHVVLFIQKSDYLSVMLKCG